MNKEVVLPLIPGLPTKPGLPLNPVKPLLPGLPGLPETGTEILINSDHVSCQLLYIPRRQTMDKILIQNRHKSCLRIPPLGAHHTSVAVLQWSQSQLTLGNRRGSPGHIIRHPCSGWEQSEQSVKWRQVLPLVARIWIIRIQDYIVLNGNLHFIHVVAASDHHVLLKDGFIFIKAENYQQMCVILSLPGRTPVSSVSFGPLVGPAVCADTEPREILWGDRFGGLQQHLANGLRGFRWAAPSSCLRCG